jgi:hypothetical protein
MAELELVWPVGGLSDDRKPFKFTEDARNVRNVDPKTGVLRGAQRSGLSRLVQTRISATDKVAELTFVTHDENRILYSEENATDWTRELPGLAECLVVKTDRQGNVYAVEAVGGALHKYNPKGRKQWTLSLPLPDESQVVRALHIDEFDGIYAAISAGGEQDQGRIWKYVQDADGKPVKVFEIETEFYVAELTTREDRLYVVTNDDEAHESKLVVYLAVDTSAPFVEVEGHAPYPAHGVAAKGDGSIMVCSPANADRGAHPRFTAFHKHAQDWTPKEDLTAYEDRVWAHLDATNIDGLDNATLTDGQDLLFWRDLSGKNRHLYSGANFFLAGNQEFPPTFEEEDLTSFPGVRFSGDNSGASATWSGSVMRSGFNTARTEKTKDRQRTLLPAYTNSMFALFMVVRIDTESGQHGVILGQRNALSSTPSLEARLLVANRAYTAGAAPVQTDGHIGYRDVQKAGATVKWDAQDGTNPNTRPLSGRYDNKTSTVLITVTCDGGIDPTTATAFRSVFRVNGVPVDVGTSELNRLTGSSLSQGRTSLGRWLGSNFGFFSGTICEILVLDKYDATVLGGGNGLASDVVEMPRNGNADYPDGAFVANSDTELERIEGRLAWKWRIAHMLDDGANTGWGLEGGSSNGFVHPFTADAVALSSQRPPNPAGRANTSEKYLEQLSPYPILAKYAPGSLETRWVASAVSLGGVGLAVAVDSAGRIVNHGLAQGSDDAKVRRIVDNGTSYSIFAADAWAFTGFPSTDWVPDYLYPKIALDEFDNVYIPWNDEDFAGTTPSILPSVLVLNNDDGSVLIEHDLLTNHQCYAVAVHPEVPEDTGLVPERAEVIFAGSRIEGADNSALFRAHQILATPVLGSPRAVIGLAVAGGDIKTFNPTTGAVGTPTGGSAALDSTSTFWSSATLFSQTFFTDGISYRYYAPKTDTVAAWEATGSGEIPARCKLMAAWRGRLVLARGADDPHNWFMSEQGDAFAWDFFPPEGSTGIEAVNGNDSRVGPSPDIINTIIPYNDDTLFFGGDHSIHLMRGDPAMGGGLDLVSDITGMAFGSSWAKDPEGIVYFFGSLGGVYRMVPGGIPKPMTDERIERRLEEVDLSVFMPRLVWNTRDNGLHVLFVPFGAGGTSVSHYFWEKRTDSWWEDTFGNADSTGIQPTAVVVYDGDDPDDRRLIFGCEDGYLRVWDAAANDDDQTAAGVDVRIDAYATIGPIADSRREGTLSRLQLVLADDQDGCAYEVFGSPTADSMGTIKARGVVNGGRSRVQRVRVRGQYLWVRVRNASLGERFAYETGFAHYSPAGRQRVH